MWLNLAEVRVAFVVAAPVGTPNGETMAVSITDDETERTFRSAVQARSTGHSDKSPYDARPRTVIVSVLESLRQHFPFMKRSAGLLLQPLTGFPLARKPQ